MKIKFFKFSLFCFILASLMVVIGCSFFADPDEKINSDSGDEYPLKNKSIPEDYWGTWIRMDNGVHYYIDSECVSIVRDNYYKEKVQNGIGGFIRDSASVMRKGNSVYFKDGGENRNFSFNVSGFEDTVRSLSRIGLGHQNIIAKRENKNNSSDKETVNMTDDNKLNFSGAVSGDSQKVTISGSNSVNQNIEVNPSYSGEFMGTIPIVEDGKYGFKVTYDINKNAMGYCVVDKEYDLKLTITNVGNAKCYTSECNISSKDPNLKFSNKQDFYTFETKAPNEYEEIEFNVSYRGDIGTEGYKDVPVEITIKDSKDGYTWIDQVTLRFYKGQVPLYIKAKNIKNRRSDLNGFIIYPDGRSQYFTLPAEDNYIQDVYMPWSKEDYILAFSGASRETEVGYVFGFDENSVNTTELTNKWSFEEITAYEDNNNVNKSADIKECSKVKAYLVDEDIDFYKINNSKYPIKNDVGDIDSSKVALNAETSMLHIENDNGNGYIDSGEEVSFDVALFNNSDENIVLKDLTCTISLKSSERLDYEFVEVINSKNTYYGKINPGHYSTSYKSNDLKSNFSDMNSFSENTAYYPYRFKKLKGAMGDVTLVLEITSSYGVEKIFKIPINF